MKIFANDLVGSFIGVGDATGNLPYKGPGVQKRENHRLLITSLLVKYLWPVRRMRAAEVSGVSLGAGAVLGVIGFFVIPVVGLVVGFVLGVYLAELVHRRDQRRAWASTVHAVKGAALSVGVELAGGLIATAAWVVGLLLTQ